MQIKIYTTDGFQAYYILNEDGKLSREGEVEGEGGVPDSFYFAIEAKQTNQPEDPEPPFSGGSEFDGTAWFIWNDNDYICKYKVNGLQGAVDKEFPIKYIKESDVVDGTKKLKISNLSDEDYYWIFSDKIEELNAKNFSSWKELKNYFESDEKIIASLYYSDEHLYNDFKVLANINYSDGTKATKMLSVSKMNDGSYEKDGGKGLKLSEFVIKVDKEIKTIDYTVIYDGALDGDT